MDAALDRGTGAELWRAESGVVVASGGMPVVQRVDDAAAEDASYDENLMLQVESTLEVLDPATGAVRDRVPLPAGASESAVDGLLVVTTVGPTDRATVTAYRLDDGGTKAWETDVGAIGEEPVAAPFGDDALLIHDRIDASGDNGRTLAVVDRATGTLRAEQPGDLTLTAMSLDGAPGLLGIDGSRLEFRDAALDGSPWRGCRDGGRPAERCSATTPARSPPVACPISPRGGGSTVYPSWLRSTSTRISGWSSRCPRASSWCRPSSTRRSTKIIHRPR